MRAAASAWPRRKSTARARTTSSSDRAPASRARSGFTVPTLPSSPGTAPALFSTFSPYADDRSGVSLTTGFVDYLDRPLQHRHRAGPGSRSRGEGVRLSVAEAILNNRSGHPAGHDRHACGRAEPAGQHRVVQAVRRRLHGRRFTRDRLARRIARRRRADRRQPTRGRRHGEGILQRLGSGRRSRDLPAQPDRAWPCARLPRDRELQSVRRDIRHTRRHDEHDHWRGPAGQRRVPQGPERERREV